MYFLGVLIARYVDWCETIQPKLKRWVGTAVFFGVAVTLCLVIGLSPAPLNVIFLLTFGLVVPPALLTFSAAHSKYWRRQDEIRQDMRNRSFKIRKLLQKTKWK